MAIENVMGVLAAWAPVAVLVVACAHDLRSREIPYWIPALLVLWGVLATATGWNGHSWIETVGGFVAGGVIGWGLVALGVVLFGGGDGADEQGEDEGASVAFGGGDANLFAGVGTCVGLSSVLPVFAAIAIMGGVVALIAAARGRRDFAYAPAIALGVVLFVAYQELSAHAA